MPPAVKPISRENRIYLAIWHKAYLNREKPESVTVTASNFNMAVALRQGMYRAIRPFRNGESIDEELRQAAEHFVVYISREDSPTVPHKLLLKPRLTLTELELSLSSLGLDEEDLLLTEERALSSELQALMTESSKPARPSNPFYTRED